MVCSRDPIDLINTRPRAKMCETRSETEEEKRRKIRLIKELTSCEPEILSLIEPTNKIRTRIGYGLTPSYTSPASAGAVLCGESRESRVIGVVFDPSSSIFARMLGTWVETDSYRILVII